ncbi:phosphate ABC transporter substrate-binding protein PstS [Schumannella luteola]|uniref:Phosphate-binding protein n=1 Tax=Schumannella luteola TaxID=472059 RepID=A0A852YJ12_9MICO|nr:phosphate transport system substrate-binding protein [Schumannella luteola]TPX02318.1 phosphate ABC transporter substrate-binding protein PstS [Schumannella luteola]
MKLTRSGSIAAIALVGAVALAGCATSGGSDESAAPSKSAEAADYSKLAGTITAGGSSAQANAEQAWTTAITAQAKGLTVNYDKSQGSGGGVTNFTAGSYDFAGSDSPLKPEQTTAAEAVCGADGAVNLPIYLDGVAVIYNVEGASSLKLSGETVAKIFNLQITDWSDAAITKDNGGKALAAGPITTVARGDGSGTTQTFTNYLVATQKANWPYDASNAWPVAGNVSKQQGGSGVVNTVKATAGSIGYADHSAIGDVKAAAIGVGDKFVEFSGKGASKAFETAAELKSNGVEGDLSQTIDYAKITTADAYPIPLVSYAITCKTFKDAKQAELVKGYLGFVASDLGQKVAEKNAGSAPLPTSILDEINKTLSSIK